MYSDSRRRGEGLTDTLYGVSCQSTAVGGDFVSHYPRSLEVKHVSQATWSGDIPTTTMKAKATRLSQRHSDYVDKVLKMGEECLCL